MTLLDKARLIPQRYWFYYLPLAVAAIGLVLFLKDAPLPWEEGVEAREEAGKSIKSAHHMITGLWFGAWAALAVIAVAAVAGPLALRSLTPSFRRDRAGLGRRSTPVFFAFAAIATVIAGFQMAPRLDSSLWGDEDYTVRRVVVGQWERNADDELWFREATWTDTLFYYRTPNNHVLFSILSRLSHSGYQSGGDPEKLHFDERRLRMPAFIFGLGAILTVGYLLAVAGYRRAALAAMFLLAFHPWFLRHAPEARGYPIAMFLSPLTLAFLIKALRRGRWIYWVGFGCCEALLFYAYPGAAYLLVAINLVGIVCIAYGRRETGSRDRLTLAGRWFIANTLAALPIVFLMMPNLPQLRNYLERTSHQANLDGTWIHNNLSHIASGIPWSHKEPDNPLRPTLESSPTIGMALLILFYALVVLGIYRLVRERKLWVAIALLLPYPLLVAHAVASDAWIFQWYCLSTLR